MEQPPPTLESQPDAPKPSTMSLPARLMNIVATPGEVFAEVKTSPPSTANWLAPALILILVSWVGTWLIFSQDAVMTANKIKECSQPGVGGGLVAFPG